MTARPTVSAIIPTYNGSRWIVDAILSVQNQTCPPAEIIVVDDGSTDDTAALVVGRFPDVRVIHQTNFGEQMARNRGLALANGDVVAFLDQDDLWLPEHLEQALDLLDAHGDVALAPLARPIDGETTLDHLLSDTAPPPTAASAVPIAASQLWEGGIGGANCIISGAELLRSVGGFPTLAPGIGDYLLLVVLANRGVLIQSEAPTFAYRTHGEMSSYRYNMCERTLAARFLLTRSGLLPEGGNTWSSYLVRGFVEDVDRLTLRRLAEALALAVLHRASPRIVVGGLLRRGQHRIGSIRSGGQAERSRSATANADRASS